MLLGTVLVLLLLGGAGTASAHAAFKGSDPRDGSVLDSAPRHVTLTFTESVGLLDDSMRVIGPDNRPLDTGEAEHADDRSDTVRVTLPDDLDEGTYTVAWRIVSADSHPVAGVLLFSVGEPSATAPVAAPTEDPAVTSLYNITRYLAYGGLALLIGLTVFMAAILGGWSEPLRRPLLAGWLALLVSTVALLLLRGPYERGSGLADAFAPAVLGETLTSRPGVALVGRLALLAGAFCFVFFFVRGRIPVRESGRRGTAVTVGGVALSLGLALTWAAAEHASAGIQVPVAMTSSVLHLLAMAVWLGGLAALLTVLYRAPEDLSVTGVARFSRLAFTAVTILVVTGVYQSWRGLGSWEAFTSTSYGRILIAKLGAVLLLLVAAGASRQWTGRWGAAGERQVVLRAEERVPERVGGPIAGPVGEGTPATVHTAPASPPPADDMHRRALRRSVLAESVIGVVVLVITTLLTVTLPGRAEAETAAESAPAAAAPDENTGSSSLIPFDTGVPNGSGKVQIDLSPGRVGQNSVQALVYNDFDGGISTVPELRVSFTLRAQDVGPIEAKLVNQGGYWSTDSLQLPLPGMWTMKITVRTTEIDQVTVEKDVRVG
ncbi:copper resistance CopC/CopD family protein [Streptomyces sp. NPDC002845]